MSANYDIGVNAMNSSQKSGTCTTEQPSASVLRVRRHRQRERQGIACATVEVTGEVFHLLVIRGYLPDRCHHRRHEVDSALSKYLLDQTREAV
jgi:hypothetical protein